MNTGGRFLSKRTPLLRVTINLGEYSHVGLNDAESFGAESGRESGSVREKMGQNGEPMARAIVQLMTRFEFRRNYIHMTPIRPSWRRHTTHGWPNVAHFGVAPKWPFRANVKLLSGEWYICREAFCRTGMLESFAHSRKDVVRLARFFTERF